MTCEAQLQKINPSCHFLISPLVVQTENVAMENGRIVIVLNVPKGIDKPYHGLGSGIKRALEAWPQIDFADDHEGCLFTVTVHRTPVGELKADSGSPISSPISSPKTDAQILELIRQDALVTTSAIGVALGITKRAVLKQVSKLKAQGYLRRVGPGRGGYWEVVEGKE